MGTHDTYKPQPVHTEHTSARTQIQGRALAHWAFARERKRQLNGSKVGQALVGRTTRPKPKEISFGVTTDNLLVTFIINDSSGEKDATTSLGASQFFFCVVHQERGQDAGGASSTKKGKWYAPRTAAICCTVVGVLENGHAQPRRHSVD